jgi:hypothetical protein
MHSLSVRLLLVVLVAFAIPLQGMAAVSAGQCMAFGQHDHASGGHAADGHTQDHSHGGHDSGEASGSLPHCGPCVACCASASIAGHAGLPLLPSRSEARYFFAQFAPLGVQPDGLDRPPLAL